MRERLKKMNSDKKKSCLVFLIFFVLLSFCFYKNLESNIKGIYQSHHYPGDIRVTGFSFTTQDKLEIQVNYTYSEKINGKEISIPLKKELEFGQFIIPYSAGLNEKENYGLVKGYWESREPVSVYAPIIEKSIELNPESKKLEQELKKKIDQNRVLRGSTVKLKLSMSSHLKYIDRNSWLEKYEYQSMKHNRTVLGGWYNFPIREALSSEAIYVHITLPQGVDWESVQFQEELEKMIEKTGLPNGAYTLNTVDETSRIALFIKDGKVKERS